LGSAQTSAARTVQLMVWTFAASWLAWYACLSVGFLRYLFPAAVTATIFLGALIDDALWQLD